MRNRLRALFCATDSGAPRRVVRHLACALAALWCAATAPPAHATDDVTPRGVTQSGMLPSFVGTFGCGDANGPYGPLVTINNSFERLVALCPQEAIPDDYALTFTFTPTPSQAMTGMRFWVNSGNAYNDRELRFVDIRVNYADPITGAARTMFFDNVDIGDTLAFDQPRDVLFSMPATGSFTFSG